GRCSAPRQNRSHAGPDRTGPNLQRALSRNERRHPDLDARDIGDGIQWSGRALEGKTQVSGPGFAWGSRDELLYRVNAAATRATIKRFICMEWIVRPDTKKERTLRGPL